MKIEPELISMYFGRDHNTDIFIHKITMDQNYLFISFLLFIIYFLLFIYFYLLFIIYIYIYIYII